MFPTKARRAMRFLLELLDIVGDEATTTFLNVFSLSELKCGGFDHTISVLIFKKTILLLLLIHAC